MPVKLTKGGNISLTKEAPHASTYLVGLGWDPRSTTGEAFDLDATAIACDANGKVISDGHFVFFGNLSSPDAAITHKGDNRTGEGEGDDEQIVLDPAKLPANVEKIVFAVAIYDFAARGGQNFGSVRNAYIRILNAGDNAEIARYDLSEDSSVESGMVFGEIYRNGADWKFRAVGQGYAEGLKGIAQDFGVNV